MNSQELAALSDYEDRAKTIGRLASSDPISKRRGREKEYARSYQRLVSMGLRPQLRAKYRGIS